MTSKGDSLLRSNLPLGDTILRGASYFVTGPTNATLGPGSENGDCMHVLTVHK